MSFFHDPFRANSSSKKQEVAPASDPEPVAKVDSVPAGSSKEVLAWVDGDADRAKLALDAENASDDPRASLVSKLQKVLGS